MKKLLVTPINKLNFKSPIIAPCKKEAGCPFLQPKTDFSPSFLGQLYFSQVQSIKALKRETENFPQDIEYRKQLLINAGKNPNEYYKLRSIIGAGEMKSIMREFDGHEEFYSAGINDENIKNRTIRANPHIHTIASDGFSSVQEILDKAADYADKAAQNSNFKKEPFFLAITDHDTTESTKEAIKIIFDNPLEYKNLRLALGSEITTFDNVAEDILQVPACTHVLVYGIDPNEKSFDGFINNTKQKKRLIASKMIEEANDTYKKSFNREIDLFSKEEADNFYNPIKKGILGIYVGVENYIKIKTVLNEIVLKNPTLLEKMEQNNLPLQTDELIDRIREFYYQIDHNNKIHKPIETICEYLSPKLGIETAEIEKIIKTTPKSDQFKAFKSNIKNDLEQYKRTFTPKYNYMPTMEDVFNAVKGQDSTIMGIAHPLEFTKTLKEAERLEKYKFLIDLYMQFKDSCKEKAVFSEVYYQSYPDKLKALKENFETQKLLNLLSKELNLFRTGSADSHRGNIFKRFL
ncbi:MAG: hypothetical protein WCY19_00495 [Candidatus Gastranaerophilaceae bacterium]